MFSFIGGFALLFVVLIGLVIEQMPFGQDAAWAWMTGSLVENASWVPPVGEQPVVLGSGDWCVTLARQLSPDESHLNHGRVYGVVREANGAFLVGTPMRVEWDGGFIEQPTDANGRYEFILSPGQYAVRVNIGASQHAHFRTNLKQYFGHYTYQVDFVRGNCAGATEVVEQRIAIQTTGFASNPNKPSGLPVQGIITAGFHDPAYLKQFGREHEGIDIAVSVGTPVQTTLGGRVIWAGEHGAWGKVVAVENSEWMVIVAHLSQVLVMENEIVRVGEVVGLSGSSGNSTGPHVHYEVRLNTVARSPQRF
ncbi:MAG: M23 family metallopeptidase [Anaerolineae bacterium]|nr:M23 family metallopeptidase [Anaerolineae bacterium]